MMAALRVDDVADALLTYAIGAIPKFYDNAVDVAAVGTDELTDDGDLIITAPFVRVRFGSAEYAPTRDNTKTTYDAGFPFTLLCYEENLRSRSAERMATLKLVADVQDSLAGVTLTLPNGGRIGPIEMLGVLPVMDQDKIIDQYYAVAIRVPGIAQFPGNTRTNGGS